MKRILLGLIGLAAGMMCSAQTLEECCELAREQYPAIHKYELIEKTEKFNLSNAARAWIPQLVLAAQATWQNEAPAFPDELSKLVSMLGVDIKGAQKDQYRIALDLNQNIWDGGTTAAQRRLARSEAEVEHYKVDIELYEIEQRVEEMYFGILLLDEKAKQARLVVDLLKSNLDRLRSLHANGVALQSDVDLMEAEWLSAGQQLEQVEVSRKSYRDMLAIFIGKELDAASLERPVPEPLYSRSSARYELAMLNAQQGSLDAQRKLARSQIMPRFSAFAQGFYGYPGLDFFESMRSHDWRFNAVVGVRMAWNISGFYTHKNTQNKLRLAQNQVELQRDIFQFNTRLATVQEDGTILRLKKAVADDARIVELRRNVRMAAESQLDNGVIDVTALLQKITDENTASLNKCVHEVELIQAHYKLKRILNR